MSEINRKMKNLSKFRVIVDSLPENKKNLLTFLMIHLQNIISQNEYTDIEICSTLQEFYIFLSASCGFSKKQLEITHETALNLYYDSKE